MNFFLPALQHSADTFYLAAMSRLMYLFFLLLPSLCSTAQVTDSLPYFRITGGIQGGFIAPHREQMRHLVQGHSVGAFVQFHQLTNGRKRWQTLYNYPESGVDVFFISTGNPEQLGYQTGCAYHINLPLIRASREPRKFRHWIGLGTGVGYSTRRWDLRTNHQAAVIGSHFNTTLILSWNAQIVSSKEWDVRTGLRITHLSNGAFQLPNLGTNNVSWILSASRNSGKVRPRTRQEIPTTQTPNRKWQTTVSYSSGLKEVPPPIRHKYYIGVLSVWEDYRYSPKSALTAGFDVFYNSSLSRLFLNREGIARNGTDLIQAGVTAGYTMQFDRMDLKIMQGVYIRDKWKDTGMLYHRFGLRYAVTSHLFAQIMLKTHFSKADHGELGIGLRF